MAISTFTMSEDDYQEYVDSNNGLCLECGDYANSVEPDAREYKCEHCGANAVYGMEELMLMGRIELED